MKSFLNRREFNRAVLSLTPGLMRWPLSAQKSASTKQGESGAEILWDTFGVPHIFAESDVALARAFGWAQMRSHANLILRLYAQARGRGAEFLGEEELADNRRVLINGIPSLGKRMYEGQSASFRAYLDAFAEGMNAYAREHTHEIAEELRLILPVTPIDTLCHTASVLFFNMLIMNDPYNAKGDSTERAGLDAPTPYVSGSNCWAVSPKRTAHGNALLLMNPHLPWSGPFTFYEAQLVAPGMDAYGAALIGLPVLLMAFNDSLGWAHTVNALDGFNLYELTPAGEGYRYDGEVRSFDRSEVTIRVKQKDGTLRTETVIVQRSVQGPVVGERNGRPIAMRVTGIDQYGMLEEWWNLARTRTLSEFQTVLRGLQIPFLTVMYADRDGHIMSLFNGRVPVRTGPYDWGHVLPGDTSKTLWTQTYPYEDLPRVIDPPSGWLQNTNDPPWSTTFPMVLDPQKFPPHIADVPGMSLRSQRSVMLMESDARLTLESFITYKHSTHIELADRILEPLLVASREQGGDVLARGIAVLEKWDRTADNESRGGTLFETFANNWLTPDGPSTFTMKFEGSCFSVPWRAGEPLSTPYGIADPKQAADALEQAVLEVERRYGSADVTWGKVHRFRLGDVDLPANGAGDKLGVFRVVEYYQGSDGLMVGGADGDSFICTVEFRKSGPPLAMSLINAGNASQPGSPHCSDQLQFASRKQLRPVWRTHAELEAHLESREQV